MPCILLFIAYIKTRSTNWFEIRIFEKNARKTLLGIGFPNKNSSTWEITKEDVRITKMVKNIFLIVDPQKRDKDFNSRNNEEVNDKITLLNS